MSTKSQKWTEVIESKNSLFKIDLVELWRYKDLLYMLVKRDFVTFYKQTILGPLWFIIQPIIMTLTYVVIFGNIAGISTDGTPRFVFYLSGITFWSYFSETLNKVSTVFKDNASMLGKVYFPRLILPISIVISGLIKFFIQFFIFILFLFYYFKTGTIHPNYWILLTPFLIALIVTLSLGFGMLISSLTTKYKDLIFLITFGIQLLMFATPVLYPLSIIPSKYIFFIKLNPLTGIFECFRYGFFGNGDINLGLLFSSTIISIVILIIGVLIFNKVEKDFIDTV